MVYIPTSQGVECKCVECTEAAHCKRYNTKATQCTSNKCVTPPEDCKPPDIRITLSDGTPQCIRACTPTEKAKCKGTACANGKCLNADQCFDNKDCKGNDKHCAIKAGKLEGICAGCSKNADCQGPDPTGRRNPNYLYWCDMNSNKPNCSSQCGDNKQCQKAGGHCFRGKWCYKVLPQTR